MEGKKGEGRKEAEEYEEPAGSGSLLQSFMV